MLKKFIKIFFIILLSSFFILSIQANTNSPKYIFLFIGDGMGISQRTLTEYFYRYKNNDTDFQLTMNKFPVSGMMSTDSLNSIVTDSAAAGTALSTGFKTNNGMISTLPDGKKPLTIIELAEKQGLATGIATTTRLTHATPAVFLSHIKDRGKENNIAMQYLKTDVEYLAGGGYRHFLPQNNKKLKSKRKDKKNLINSFKKLNYKIFLSEKDTESFLNHEIELKEKIFASFSYSHMDYEIDRIKNNQPSLKEMTQKGIETLSKYKNGFFFMIEGGRIDHACHANDPVTTIYDTKELDESIETAYRFYKKHPENTLIIVTADHETGGLSLGGYNKYSMDFTKLQLIDFSLCESLFYNHPYKGNDEKYFSFLKDKLNIKKIEIESKNRIKNIMKKYKKSKEKGEKRNTKIAQYKISLAVIEYVNKLSKIGWTTKAHTGTRVPLTAVGIKSELFMGYKDNTDISKIIQKIIKDN